MLVYKMFKELFLNAIMYEMHIKPEILCVAGMLGQLLDHVTVMPGCNLHNSSNHNAFNWFLCIMN